MKRKILYIAWLALAVALSSCRKEVGPTHVHVNDPVRHYLPIVQGDELKMQWFIYNDGPNTLIIEDIQPACSTIRLAHENPRLVPIGDSIPLEFVFSSAENINLAQHTIRVFGNIAPNGEVDLQFDVTVVPTLNSQNDFEEQLLHKINKPGLFSSSEQNNPYFTEKFPFDTEDEEE